MASQPQNNPTPYDDEISLLVDIIQFFKTNFKRILLFVILGGVLGGLYGKYADPIYNGSVLISPARVAGNFVVDPKIILTKLEMNSYYSKETFLACNPLLNKDKDKDIDYDMSNIVKTSLTRRKILIMLKMESPNKETIRECLESITSDINESQKIIADPLIESKKNKLSLVEEKLMLAEQFHEQLNGKQIKNLKTTEQRFLTDLLYAHIVFNKAFEINALQDQINNLKTELSSEQTISAGKVSPINIERKSFPSEKIGLLLGSFLGLFFGIFITLIKRIKI